MTSHWQERPYSFLCVGLVLISVLATNPFLEMGLNDDWSYTYMARELAATGRLQYHGWASAMLGVQAWLAALVIRTVGFSFTAVRLTTSVFAVGCALLVFQLGRRVGLNSSFACFATLAVVLSPLFVPLAVSFMTDVPALFFLLGCFYCGMRAADAAGTRSCVLWLSAAALSGILGGTVRQVVWGAPLSVIPVITFLKRTDRRVVVSSALLFAGCALTVVLCLRWLSRQALVEWDRSPRGVGELLSIFRNAKEFVALMQTCLFLALPVLLLYFFGWWRRRTWSIVLPGLMVWTVAAIVQLGFHGRGFPFGNMVTAYGVLSEGTDAIGSRPVILSPPLLLGLSALTLAAVLACGIVLCHGSRADPRRQDEPTVSLLRFGLLCGPFYAAYLLVLLYRTHFGYVFDRYLVLLLPAINLFLLWFYQHRIQDRVPPAGWVVVVVFGGYAVATSHDYIAAARARLTAASMVMAAGVPRTKITAGLEFDGWTQIETDGRVNSALASVEPVAYRSESRRTYPSGLSFRFWSLTPSVDPDYFIVYSRQPGLVDATYPPVTYSTWLPPSTRQVFTQVLAEQSQPSGSGRER